jgi:hypothetical protein
MDQDLNFQHTMAFASSAKTSYFQVPYRCTLREVSGIVQGDPGEDQTVTVTNEPTVGGTASTLGVLTFGEEITAGAVGAWAADADEGAMVMEKGEFIKFVTSVGADAVLNMNIELDPYARTAV